MSDKVKQIYYSNWNQKLEEGHDDYWWKIDTISSWIGNSLEAKRSGFSSMPYFFSTIAVLQTKEKFGQCRVYVSFASEELVSLKYKEVIKDISSKNDFYIKWKNNEIPEDSPFRDVPDNIVKIYNEKYPLSIPSYSDYKELCRVEDIKYYRNVYMESIKLWPEYRNAIIFGADWPEYLYENEDDLNKYYEKIINNFKESFESKGDLDEEYAKNRLKHLHDDWNMIKKISDFKGS